MAFLGNDDNNNFGLGDDFLQFLQDQQNQGGPNYPNQDNPLNVDEGSRPGEPGVTAPNWDQSNSQSPRERAYEESPSAGPAMAPNPDFSNQSTKGPSSQANSESPRELAGSGGPGAAPNPDYSSLFNIPNQPQSVTPPSPEASQGPVGQDQNQSPAQSSPSVFDGGLPDFGAAPPNPNQPNQTAPPESESPSPVASQPAAPASMAAPSPMDLVSLGGKENNESSPLGQDFSSLFNNQSQGDSTLGQTAPAQSQAPSPVDETQTPPDQPVLPSQFESLGKNSLFGSAGGLLGGGLGTPSGGGEQGTENDSLLPMLLKLLGQ